MNNAKHSFNNALKLHDDNKKSELKYYINLKIKITLFLFLAFL